MPNQLESNCRASLQSVKPWLFLFYIWGIQLLLNGFLDLLGEEALLKKIKLSILLIAILASGVLLFSNRSQTPSLVKLDLRTGELYRILLPLALMTGSIILLWFIEASDKTLILNVVRAQLLAFFYVLLGTFLGKELVWLGFWLFTLIAIVSMGYLGFVPLVFEAMGGLSLIVCGWVLLRWSRERGNEYV